MDQETNPREELYNQFKASLKEPVSERYFSEDELVEIFDFAGDVADDYAQFEVLFCAARLYPDSQPLIDRKALFYLDTTESDDNPESPTAKAFVSDNPDMTSPLMDIIRLEVNHPENPVEALDFLLQQYDTLNDEEIIRLVDLACDLDQYTWVSGNLDKLRNKTPYAPTILYEVMNRATEAEDFETVIKVTEELIETEPFAAGYWAALFRAQARLGREVEARTSFDYAKDLAASDEETIAFLADVIAESAPYLVDEGLKMLDDWLLTDPSNYRIFTARGMLMLQKQQFEQLEKDLVRFIAKYGVQAQSLRHLFLLSHEGSGQILRRELNKGNGVFSPQEIDELLDNMHLNSNHIGMNELMTVLSDFMGERLPLPLTQYWIEALFWLREYNRIVEIFLKYPQDEVLNFLTFPPRGPAFWYLSLLAFLKTANPIEDMIDLNALRKYILEQIASSPVPVKMTYLPLLYLLVDMINHPVTEYDFWLNYNPLGQIEY